MIASFARAGRFGRTAAVGTFIGLCWGAAGCRSHDRQPDQKANGISASASAASASAKAARVTAILEAAKRRERLLRHPVGPSLAVQAGVGLGPIRFGATVATVERLMGLKCDELTKTYCRMIDAAVEFKLDGGVVSEIFAYRFDRPVPGHPGKTWGVFAGGIPPDLRMTMVPEAIRAVLGSPKSSVHLDGKNPNRTVLKDTYDGLELEYDLNPENGRLMLGQLWIFRPPSP